MEMESFMVKCCQHQNRDWKQGSELLALPVVKLEQSKIRHTFNPCLADGRSVEHQHPGSTGCCLVLLVLSAPISCLFSFKCCLLQPNSLFHYGPPHLPHIAPSS